MKFLFTGVWSAVVMFNRAVTTFGSGTLALASNRAVTTCFAVLCGQSVSFLVGLCLLFTIASIGRTLSTFGSR